jgi:hypothetical protein
LAADLGQRIDDFGAQPEKSEFKHLKKPDGTRADDHGVRDGGKLGALS